MRIAVLAPLHPIPTHTGLCTIYLDLRTALHPLSVVACSCLSQALHGMARQNAVAMGSAMKRFVARIESVHSLLSKDAVRVEARNTLGCRICGR